MSQFIEMFGNTSKEMLGKFIQVIRGVSYKPSDVKTADDPDTAVILRSNNINDANLNTDEVVYIDKNRVSGDQYLRINDIVVCASNGSKALVGKAAINKTLTNQYAHGAFCLLVRPNDNINPVYLNTFFQTSLYKKQIDELAAGSNILNIKQEHLTNMILPLPIIEEQNKFAIIAEQADKSKFGGFKSQFIEMYHKTHNTQTLESVCAIISKGITPKYVDFSSIAVVNQACIQWDGQHLENIKYHNEEIPFKKRALQTGDVLLNATGTGTLGRCCVFNCPSNDNIYINDGHVIAIATDKSILLPEVLNAYLSLNDTQAEIYRLYVTGSTNQVDIVFSDIKKMKVPVPNIDDQISFIKILNQADKSKSYVRIALKSLESMLGYCIRQVA